MTSIVDLDEVGVFSSAGSNTPFSAAKLAQGYTGSENDPAFAENINDYWNQLSTAINQHATEVNDNLCPVVEQNQTDIATLQGQVARNSFPTYTIFPWLEGAAAPTGWIILQGQTFDGAMYPLLLSANGGSNVLPDLRDYVPRGATGGNASTRQTTNGSVINHNHGAGTLSVDSNGDHFHSLARPVPTFPGVTQGSTFNTGNDGDAALDQTESAGSHSHNLSGSTGFVGSNNGNIPKSITCHWITRLE